MKYRRWHDEIIRRAKERNLSTFVEWHHIVPRSLGGADNEDNLVALTYQEHFLVHWLLTKIVCGRDRYLMVYALQCMAFAMPGRKVGSWRVEIAKRTLRRDYLLHAKIRIEGRRLAWKEYLLKVKIQSESAVTQLAGLNPARSRDRTALKSLANQYLKADTSRLDRRAGRSSSINHRANRLYAEAKQID